MPILKYQNTEVPIYVKEGLSAYFYAENGGFGGTEQEFSKALANLSNPYEIGGIYQSFYPTSPGAIFGGSWENLEKIFLLSAGKNFPLGLEETEPGEEKVTLTVQNLPEHYHELENGGGRNSGGSTYHEVWVNKQQVDVYTQNAGGVEAHENMPPYIAIYTWKRVR